MSEPATQKLYFQADDIAYWSRYIKARPTYDEALYSMVYDYHATRGSNRWHLAHDIGTGPGNVANMLTMRFDHVVASDVSPSHVVAASTLRDHGLPKGSDPSKLSYVTSRGEDVSRMPQAQDEWNGKTDLVVAAECITLMDAKRSLDCFAELLAPGGTLAIWFYGRPVFVEQDASGAERLDGPVQVAYNKLVTRMFGLLGNPGDEQFGKSVKNMYNWLEYVRLDTDEQAGKWGNMKRYQWNYDRPMCFFSEEVFLPELQRTPMSAEQKKFEEIIQTIDRDFWAQQWTSQTAYDFVLANRPTFAPGLEKDPDAKKEIEQLYQDLEKIMGGPNNAVKVTWPVTLMLATKS